jgi:MtN3 and saliva related transmembrane protein
MEMETKYVTLLGITAGILTTTAFFPQIYKIWKTKSTRDLSLGMFGIFSTGVFLWLVYGVLIGSLPVILANAVTLALSVSILYFKLRYK